MPPRPRHCQQHPFTLAGVVKSYGHLSYDPQVLLQGAAEGAGASRLPPETVGSDGSAVCAPRACSSGDAGHLRIPSAPHPLGTQTDSGGGFLFPCNTENYMRMYNVRGVVSQ